MSKFIGRLTSLGLARESSRKTLVAPTIYMRHTSLDFDDDYEKITSEAGVGRLEQGNQAHLTRRMSSGSVEGEVGSQSIGLLLYSLLGTLNTTQNSPVSGAHSHAFSLAQSNQHPMLTLAKVDPDRTKLYHVMPTSMTLSVTQGEFVTHSTELMGMKGNDWSALTPSYPDELKFLGRNVSIKFAADIAGLGAAAAVNFKSLSLSIVQNTAYDDQLGTLEPNDIINQSFDITGEFELNNDDSTDTFRNYLRDNTMRAMEIVFTSDGYVTGTTPATLTFQFPKVSFQTWERNDDLDALSTQTIEFRALTDLANSQASVTTATLVNGEDGTNY